MFKLPCSLVSHIVTICALWNSGDFTLYTTYIRENFFCENFAKQILSRKCVKISRHQNIFTKMVPFFTCCRQVLPFFVIFEYFSTHFSQKFENKNCLFNPTCSLSARFVFKFSGPRERGVRETSGERRENGVERIFL
jgi:hypothetical protein